MTLKLLRELIALPSVNPAFRPANDPWAGEQRVADFLAARAGHAGLDVEFQKVVPGRANLLVRLSPTGKVKRRILLAPHLDTVDVANEGQFSPRSKNGRLYGRGASDTKGSVAAMFQALCEMAKGPGQPGETEIIFAGLIDEENAQKGSSTLAASGFKADLAIVGEPTRLKVVTAHKGDVWLEFKTRGKAAHGARPELGRNAVLEMARIVELLETAYAETLCKRFHPLLGRPTISVGSIAGGTQPNIVPAQCLMSADRRTIPGETEATVRREVRALLRKGNLKATMASVKHAPCLPLETSPQLPLVRQFLQCARQTKPVGVDFFCDASVLSRGGLPSVVFGPGDIAQAHTTDEWISIQSLERGKALLLYFLKSLP